MGDFTNECISLGLGIDVNVNGDESSINQGITKFYHKSNNDGDQSVVENLKSDQVRKDVDKTVFLVGRICDDVDDTITPSNTSTSIRDNDDLPSSPNDTVEYGRLGRNKALSSVFVLDNVLLPLLRQEVSKRQKANQESNLRSSLHLTYAKKFASHVCRFNEQTENGVKLSLPADLIYNNSSANERGAKQEDIDLTLLETAIEKWILSIQSVIEFELKQPHMKVMKNPLEEIEFWRRRHTVFSGILEQLKNKKIKSTLDRLDVSESLIYKKFAEKVNEVSKLEAEAAENMKFLATLERHFRVLNDGSLEGILSTIPALLDGMRMVWTISKFYCRDERMAPLMELVGKQIAAKVREKIDLQEVIKGEFKHSHDLLLEAKRVLEQWKTSYIDTRAKIEAMGKGQRQWEFDRSSLFEKTEYMSEICAQMITAITAIENLNQFIRPEITMVMGSNNRGSIAYEELERLQRLILEFTLDPFDRINEKEWNKLRNKFNSAISGVEEHADSFLRSSFQQLQSSEAAFHLIKQFNALISSSPRIRQIISLRQQDMLQQYERELEEIEDYFIQFKDDPPLSMGYQKSPGSIIWANGLYRRAKRPILLFQKEEKLLENGLGFKVKNSYLRFARSIESYNDLIFNTWEERARIISNRCLRMPLLRICGDDESISSSESSDCTRLSDQKLVNTTLPPSIKFPTLIDHGASHSGDRCLPSYHTRIHSNFSPTMRNLIEETKHFDAMGYEVPEEARHLTLQEQAINRHAVDLQKLTNMINDTLSGMTLVEFTLMDSHMKFLNEIINPALRNINWSSQRITAFTSRAFHAIEKFRSILCDVRKHFSTAENLVLKIEQETLVDYNTNDTTVSPGQLLSAIEATAQTKMSNLNKHYCSIGQMLINIEMAVCDTDNGSSAYLEHCYCYWSKRIYNAITEMIFRSIFTCCQKLLSGQSKKSPFCTIDLTIDDNEIISEPSLSEMKKYYMRCVRLACDATRQFSRWMHRTCLLSKDNVQGSNSRASAVQLEYSFHKDATRNSIMCSTIIGQHVAILSLLRDYDCEVRELKSLFNEFNSRCAYWKTSLNQRIQDEIPTLLIDGLMRESNSNLVLSVESKDVARRGLMKNSFGVGMFGVLKHAHDVVHELKLDLNDILSTISRENLDSLENTIQMYNKFLNAEPKSVDELKIVINHIKEIHFHNMITELKCKDLREKYLLMKQQGITVVDEEFAHVMSLFSNWQNLVVNTRVVDTQLDNKKEDYKKDIAKQSANYQSMLITERERFVSEGPGVESLTLDQGLILFQEWETKLGHLLCLGEELNEFKEILDIDVIVYPDLHFIEESMKELGQVYEVYTFLNRFLQSQSSQNWICFEIRTMSTTLISIGEKLQKMSILYNKTIWNKMHSRVIDLNYTVPLLEKLQNDSMKDRHWEYLSNQSTINLKSLTFSDVIDMNLHLKVDEVDKVLEVAYEEEKLENSLMEINGFWSSTELQLKPYDSQSGQFILESLDKTFLHLEDHLLLLHAMLGSKFSSQYQQDMKQWESALNLVIECLNHWSRLQQKWIYLESIFSGSNDIRAQLPKGAQQFDEVSKQFFVIMKRTYEVPNILDCCSEERVASILRLIGKLDLCQKSLSEYLAVKRAIFARFYFLSDEEMISILGNSDVGLIETHLAKMFDNIKKLDFENGHDKIVGITSKEQEMVSLTQGIDCSGRVEEWMGSFDEEMGHTVHNRIRESLFFRATESQEQWIRKSVGMCAITSAQIWWTWQVEDAFKLMQNEDGQALQRLQLDLNADLSEMITLVRTQLDSNTRKKVNALVITKVHSRDTIGTFLHESVINEADFQWKSKLRFYFIEKDKQVSIQQCVGSFEFGNEYLGLASRLVLTPLTDRCYLTMTQALAFGLGGAVLGPAGTGKTESIKDLARSFGLPCFVFNCSEGLDYITMASIFAGLLQTGAWGCFDEFNRIKLEVLSVISAQLEIISNALYKGYETVDIGGNTDVRVKKLCGFSSLGVFVTMNPSYSGRVELPENLKSLFRPIAMVTPDYYKIIENVLFSEGFYNSRGLAKKVVSLYALVKDQISREYHYDFGLRSLKAVLTMSSKARVKYPDMCEEELIVYILKSSNIAKLMPHDETMFREMLRDLFPDIKDSKNKEDSALVCALKTYLSDRSYISTHPNLQEKQIEKAVQLYHTHLSRHSTMLIGPSSGGKTFLLHTLAGARLKFDGTIIKLFKVNPKAQSLRELHGHLDVLTRDWTDGILSQLLRNLNQPLPIGRCKEERWVVLDGDVDPIWVENLNSVMDDNRLLTLPNGERIDLKPHCSIIFEVHDLQYASPATISRCGMIWVDAKDLPYKLFFEYWVKKRYVNVKENKTILHLFSLYVEPTIEFVLHGKRKGIENKETMKLSEVLYCQPLELCRQLCHFLDAYLPPAQEEVAVEEKVLKNIFIFCIMFGVGGRLSSDSKKKLHLFLLDICDLQIPQVNIYDYYFCLKSCQWHHIDVKLEDSEVSTSFDDYHNATVPTILSISYQNILKNLVKYSNTMLFGERGTTKTSICSKVLSRLPNEEFSKLKVNMTSIPTSSMLKQIINKKVEKSIGNYYSAPSSKNLVIFVDDLHVSETDTFGTKQPVEFLRTLLHQGFYYCCDDGLIQQKYVKDLHMVGVVTASSRNEIDLHPRFLSQLCLLSVPNATEQDLIGVFNQKLKNRVVAEFGLKIMERLSPTFENIRHMSTEMLRILNSIFPSSPSKFSYSFTVSNLSQVYEGLFLLDEKFYKNPTIFMHFWKNEIHHALFDQLSSESDLSFAQAKFENVMREEIDPNISDIVLKSDLLFLDLNQVTVLNKDYRSERVGYSCEKLQNIFGVMVDKWTKETRKNRGFSFILFDFAIKHLVRIFRVLQRKRGNLLLVGFGGSGKRSLVQLASFALQYAIFDSSVKCNYSEEDFRNDVKELLKQAVSVPTILLLTEAVVNRKCFLEILNDMLNSSTLLGIFEHDELQVLCDQFQHAHEESLLEKCLSNLHVVFTLSPSGDSLKFLCHRFPTLVSSCVMDWFFPWPNEALKKVAVTFISNAFGQYEYSMDQISGHLVFIHNMIHHVALEFERKEKRFYQITSQNFLDYIQTFGRTYKDCVEQKKTLSRQYQKGLSKMSNASQNILEMKKDLKQQKTITDQKTKDVEELIALIEKKTEQVTSSSQVAAKKQNEVAKHGEQIEIEKQEADSALFEALPAIEAATEALKNIRREDLQELKAFNNPPIQVKIVCQMCTILNPTGEQLEETWLDGRKILGNVRLLDLLKEYPKEKMTEKMYQRCKQILKENEKQGITIENLATISKAGKGLLVWVLAILKYFEVAKHVNPLRKKVKEMQRAQTKTKGELKNITTVLENLDTELAQLRVEYEEAKSELSELQHKSSHTEKRLISAISLVNSLRAEQDRWKTNHEDIEKDLALTFGNALLFSSFQSYCGAFNDEYRKKIIETVKEDLLSRKIAFNSQINPHEVVLNDAELQQWAKVGQSMEIHQVQNCTLLMKGSKFPLVIDPQQQALRWIKRYYKTSNNLCVKSIFEGDYIKHLAIALEYGNPMVIENVNENLDTAINNILSQKTDEDNGRRYVRLKEQRIHWHDNFRLYLFTKLDNPRYPPEVTGAITLLNFSMTKNGLLEELLSIVLKQERPELEAQYQNLVQEMDSNTTSLNHFEKLLLQELNSSSGHILDNEILMETLNYTSEQAESIKQKIADCNKTKLGIEQARLVYSSVAQRGAMLYFASSQLTNLNKMYQLSLPLFTNRFLLGLKRAKKSDLLATRLEQMVISVTKEIFDFINIGIFNDDRLVFAFNLSCLILTEQNRLETGLLNFFLKGELTLSTNTSCKEEPGNATFRPQSISPSQWELLSNLTQCSAKFALLEKELQNDDSFFLQWMNSQTPELEQPTSMTANEFDTFHKLCLMRIFRPEHCYKTVKHFISETMSNEFVSSPVLNYEKIFLNSSSETPILLLLSNGADPFPNIKRLGEHFGFAAPQKLHMVALGQGQGQKALQSIKTAAIMGHWVLLQNCHLLMDWVSELETHLNGIDVEHNKDFRLWLTTAQSNLFPIGISQISHRVVIEEPNSLRVNMQRNLDNLSEAVLDDCLHPRFGPILFSLTFVHSLMQERQKYGKLGWNVPYNFTQSDFTMSHLLLSTHLSKLSCNEDVSWDILKYLIGNIIYGGRLSDREDERILQTYFDEYFGDFLFVHPGRKSFCLIPQDETYCLPDSFDNGLVDCTRHIKTYPLSTKPAVLGLNPNAKMKYFKEKIQETWSKSVLMTRTSSAVYNVNSQSQKSDQVLSIAIQILGMIAEGEKNVKMFELSESSLVFQNREDSQQVDNILCRELKSWNQLCTEMFDSLNALVRALKGETGMSEELDELTDCFYEGNVPPSWTKLSAQTSKNLNSWIQYIERRYEQYNKWFNEGQPNTIWLGGLHLPRCFLSTILQTSSRANGWALDETILFTEFASHMQPDKFGSSDDDDAIYISGLFLDGATWDTKNSCLIDQHAHSESYTELPLMKIVPMHKEKFDSKKYFRAPVYATQLRNDSNGNGYIFDAYLATDKHHSFWILQGVAVLMNTE